VTPLRRAFDRMPDLQATTDPQRRCAMSRAIDIGTKLRFTCDPQQLSGPPSFALFKQKNPCTLVVTGSHTGLADPGGRSERALLAPAPLPRAGRQAMAPSRFHRRHQRQCARRPTCAVSCRMVQDRQGP